MINTARNALLPLAGWALGPMSLAFAGDSWVLTSLLLEGDVVSGVGAVTRIDNLAINDQGDWQVEADTNNSDTDSDTVLIRNGVLVLQEGQALSQPLGALLDSLDSIELNDAGDTSFNHFLDGTSGNDDDSGIYFGDNLLIQEGDPLSLPEFSPGTNWIGFFETKLNDSNQVVVIGSIDDPNISSSVDRVIARLTIAPDGTLAGTSVVVAEGDLLPGATEAVADVETNPHSFALADDGLLMWVADLTGDTASDQAICVEDQILYREGDASPIPGRPWESFGLTKIDRHEIGGLVFTATVQGDNASDSVIIFNDTVFRQEGQPVPGMPGSTFTSFGSGPVYVGAQGKVLWFGAWSDGTTSGEGLFFGDELVVETGVTQIDGQTVVDLSGIQDGYRLSDAGTRILFEAELADGRQGAFLAELDPAVEVLSTCTANLGSMTTTNGGARLGQGLDLEFNTSASPNVWTSVYFSPGLAPLGGPCGLLLDGIGEVAIDFTNYQILLPSVIVVQFIGDLTLQVPTDPSLLGKDAYLQASMVDLSGIGVQPVYLTNGLRLCIGV